MELKMALFHNNAFSPLDNILNGFVTFSFYNLEMWKYINV